MALKNFAIKVLSYIVFITCINGFVGLSRANSSDCFKNKAVNELREIYSILRSGGFSGLLDNNAEIKILGTIKNLDACFYLFLYTYTSKTGAQHMTKRLMVLSKNTYLGSYSIDELPNNITGNVVYFPGKEAEGNFIDFSGKVPPQKVYLGGEVRWLFK